ncbi:pentapeptide repeat-containing protein [Nocardia tenerifensis]|nr:pentapeptide repeat-containing protein [Nocardia tenerifensis]
MIAGVLAYANGQRTRVLLDAHHREDADRERERYRDDSRRARESALRERYATIVNQVAHDSAAVRLGGVYALSSLADDWHAFGDDDERQVCINLLRLYLRGPWPGQVGGEEPTMVELAERDVRRTILRLIADRRNSSDEEKSWSTAYTVVERSVIIGCDLGNFLLAQANLNRADLRRSNLGNANLREVQLERATMDGTDLTSANLAGANLCHASLIGALLTGSNLAAADFTGADLSDADLTDAVIAGAHWGEIKYSVNTKWPSGFRPPVSR